MGDLRDILGIQAPKAPSGPVMPGSKTKTMQPPPPMEPRAKRPRLSREVMSLKASLRGTMGGLMPSLISDEAEAKKKFKAKILLGTKRVGKWEKKAFKNPSRGDNAVFYHWQKAKVLESTYRFAKWNRKLSIPRYTNEEYEAHFKSDLWTREETDYLWDMAFSWDLRFIVICDRWNPPSNSIKRERTVEELKDRYYTIQRGLLPLRKVSEEELSSHPLLLHPYDPVRETERKRQQDEATQRSEDDIALEHEITTECARIDATFKKHSEDALKYLRLVKKQQKYFANLKLERLAYQAAKDMDERAKIARGLKNAPAAPTPTPNSSSTPTSTAASTPIPPSTSPAPTGSNPSSTAPTAPGTTPTSSSAMDIDTNNAPSSLSTSQSNIAPGQPVKMTRRHPAAYSRTHSKPYTNPLSPLLNQQKYAAYFAKSLPELGIESVSRSNFILVSAVVELRCDLLLLHEMQKLVAEKSYELEVLRTLRDTMQERLKIGTKSTSSSALPSPAQPAPKAMDKPVSPIEVPKSSPEQKETTVVKTEPSSAMDVDK